MLDSSYGERLSRLIDHATEMRYSPKDAERVLSQYVSWSPEEDRPVTASEYIAANLPDKAASLGIIPVKDKNFLLPSALDEQSKIQFAIAYVDQNINAGEVLQIGHESYDDDQMIGAIREQTGQGLRFMEGIIRERDFLLRIIMRGQFIIDPNQSDIGDSIKYPDFPF